MLLNGGLIDFEFFAFTVKAGGMRIVQHKNTSPDHDKSAAASDVANAALKVSTRYLNT